MRTIKLFISIITLLVILQCKRNDNVSNSKSYNDTIINKNFFDIGKLLPSFRSPIVKDDEDRYRNNYSNIQNNVKKLKSEFFINYKNFDSIISNNLKYKYCKFYFIEEDSLNLGLSLSNNNGNNLNEKNDNVFILKNTKFLSQSIETNFKKFNDQSGLNESIKQFTNNSTPTQVIEYKTVEVYGYNKLVSSFVLPDALKFKMFLYDSNLSDSKRKNKISFAVHPHLQGVRDDKTIGYDAGTLYP